MVGRNGDIISLGQDGKVWSWDLATGKERRRMGESILALSPDGQVLAVAGGGGPARLWELASRRQITGLGPNVPVTDVAFAPDGRTLAFINGNGDVILHNWLSSEFLGRLCKGGAGGRQLFFSPDGRRLATAGNDESSVLIWDVSRMVDRRMPSISNPSDEELQHWWADLREHSPAKAYKAIWGFAAADADRSLPFLAKVLRPAKNVAPAAVARWIKELDSDDFEVRERASRELKQCGEAVVDALRQAKKGKTSVEQARRLDELLEELDPIPPEELRSLRALAALQHIGGQEAPKLVAVLAGGADGARLTREAKLALRRLNQGER